MIQPAALPAVAGLLPLGEALPTQTAEGLEGADFGALLAIEAGSFAPPGLPAKLPEPPVPTASAALQTAPVLPEDGKELPVALPVEGSGDAPAFAPQIAPAPTATADARQGPAPSLAAAIALARPNRSARPVAAVRSESSGAEAPVASVLGEAPEAALAQVTALQDAASALAIPPEPQVKQLGDAVPEPAPAAMPQVATEAPGPRLPRALVIAPNVVRRVPPAPLAANEPREPASVAAPITLSVIAVPVMPAPRIAEARLRLTLPAASAAAPLIGEAQPNLILPANGAVQAAEGLKPTPAEPRAQPAAVANERQRVADKIVLAPAAAEQAVPATVAAPAVPAPVASPAFTPAEAALRPHDFTQLVDRLVAARELVQPQAFQVSVQHGEFGQVQLRFQREGEGLNITMASADPDFARVVNAAPAPVLPALPAEPAGQGGARSDSPSQSASGNGSPAQNRGSSPERREDRTGSADNPANARQGEERGSRRSGIFA